MTANEYLEKNFKMLRETESNELSYDECLDSKYNVSGCYHYQQQHHMGPNEEKAGGKGKVQREGRGWRAGGQAAKHASV